MIDYILNDGDKFFSKDYGIIHLLSERRSPINSTRIRDVVSKISINNKQSINGGGNVSKKRAFVASIGEAIERYCLKSYNPHTFVTTSYKQIKCNKPEINKLNFFLDSQLMHEIFPRFLSVNEINWVIGKSLVSQFKSAIPASLVYLPYQSTKQDFLLSVQLSPGTACHYDPVQASLIAILECIERDSFTLFWEAGIKFPQVNPEFVESILIKNEMQLMFGKICCLDLTTDLNIPVVLTIILSDNPLPPFISIGIASSIEPLTALKKSIMEAITSWRSSYELVKKVSFDFNETMEKLMKQPDFMTHAMYHCFVDTRPYVNELISNCPTSVQFTNESILASNSNDHSKNLEFVRSRFLALAYDVTMIDITSDDIKAYGLYVMRAISLDLMRPSLGLKFRHLNNPRLLTVPKKLNLFSYRSTYQDILDFRIPSP